MDTTKVKNWNEAKYRISHWLMEKMREVSIGQLLSQGHLPSSLLEINVLLNEVTIMALLPYETYENGFFAHESMRSAAFMINNNVQQQKLQSLIEKMGEGQLVQYCLLKTKHESIKEIIVASEALADSYQSEFLDSFKADFSRLYVLDAPQLISLLHPLLSPINESAESYDEQILLCRQLGDSDTRVSQKTVDMVSGEHKKSFRIYSLRCLPFDEYSQIHSLLPSLTQHDEFVITANYWRDKEGLLWGQLIVVVLDKENIDSRVRKLFFDNGWLIEQECAHPILLLQAALPMGLSLFNLNLLREHHRFMRLDNHDAMRIMPMLMTARND